MRIDPTPDQIEAFRRDGFVVIENVLDAGELETWRATVGDAVRERVELQNGLNNQFEGGDPFYAAVFTQALRLGDTHAGIRPLVRAPELGKLAGDLIGAEAMRIWHDQALVKEPHGNQTTWHRDTPYWAFHTRTAVNFWIALDDATLANGCLWYLPGTHLMGDYDLVKIGRNMTDIFKAYPQWAAIEPVAAPCPAGSIVIHNSMVVHGAGPNMTTKRRRAMTVAYFPDGTVYNGTPDTLPPAYSRTLTTGDALDDDRYVPLAWSRDGRTARPAAAPKNDAPMSLIDVLSAVRVHAARASTDAPIRIDFGGDGGLTMEGAEVSRGDATPAALTVTTDLGTWSELVAGTLDPRVAYMGKRVRYEGDMALVPTVRALWSSPLAAWT